MKYWLLKTEPGTFGIDDLARAPHRRTSWDGVRNFQARNFIRDQMQKNDEAFLYHSSCAEPGIAGIVRIVRAAYPDATAFERGNPHYDSDSDPGDPRWYALDIQMLRPLQRVIGLKELRAYAQRELRGLILLRAGNRLSVMPVDAAQWRFVLSLESVSK
ncbi:MAG: EVE domain-containing protein [Steroidobacterales bacterium]